MAQYLSTLMATKVHADTLTDVAKWKRLKKFLIYSNYEKFMQFLTLQHVILCENVLDGSMLN